jgi:hypothetical protein
MHNPPTRTCRTCGVETTEIRFMVRYGLALPPEYVCINRAACRRRVGNA